MQRLSGGNTDCFVPEDEPHTWVGRLSQKELAGGLGSKESLGRDRGLGLRDTMRFQ